MFMHAMSLLLNAQIPWSARNMQRLRHSFLVGNAVARIAEALELDPERAFICGALHDIARFTLSPAQAYQHPRRGYEMLHALDPEAATVCVLHPFPCPDSDTYVHFYCKGDEEEVERLKQCWKNLTPSPYIPLVQLCDKLASHEKYVTLETKFACYMRPEKHMPEDAGIAQHQAAYQSIRADIECDLGMSLYRFLGISE